MGDAVKCHTPCHAWHVAHGGRMVDFAGWDMPVQYTSIVAEHQAVRTQAGLFDIAHMGRLRFTGPDAARFLNAFVTNNVRDLELGQIQYALVVNEAGGILDDVLVYRFPDHYLLVVNASNRQKILDEIPRRRGDFQFTLEDITLSHGMLALQGPLAEELLNPLVDIDLRQVHYYSGAGARVMDRSAFVTRTGYTGEDGFEVVLPAAEMLPLWEELLRRGADRGVIPCGLGCRDTLRLEAAMPLYGHELSEQMDPYTAGLGWAVKLNKGEFTGREALARFRDVATRKKRVGLFLEGKRIAREGALVLQGEQNVGVVTSGTFSPTLEKSLAMAYVEPQCAAVGTPLTVEIRGKREGAMVTALPFYTSSRPGPRRK